MTRALPYNATSRANDPYAIKPFCVSQNAARCLIIISLIAIVVAPIFMGLGFTGLLGPIGSVGYVTCATLSPLALVSAFATISCLLYHIPTETEELNISRNARFEADLQKELNEIYKPPFSLCEKEIQSYKSCKQELSRRICEAYYNQASVLDLANFNLRQLPTQLSALKKLEKINLENNGFDTVPDVLKHLPNLKELNLSNNNLNDYSYFLQDIADLKHLQTLNLSHNRLSNLHGLNSQKLRDLNVSYNCMVQVSLNEDDLPNLEALDLSHNYIQRCLPSSSSSRLNRLDLSYNQLVSLYLPPFPNLQRLNVSHNSSLRYPPIFLYLYPTPHSILCESTDIDLALHRKLHALCSQIVAEELNLLSSHHKAVLKRLRTLANATSQLNLDLSYIDKLPNDENLLTSNLEIVARLIHLLESSPKYSQDHLWIYSFLSLMSIHLFNPTSPLMRHYDPTLLQSVDGCHELYQRWQTVDISTLSD